MRWKNLKSAEFLCVLPIVVRMNMRYVPRSYAYEVKDFMVMMTIDRSFRLIHCSHYITTEISYQQLQAGIYSPQENTPINYFENNANDFPIHWNHILNDLHCDRDCWDVRRFSTYREHKDVPLKPRTAKGITTLIQETIQQECRLIPQIAQGVEKYRIRCL